MPNLRRVGRPCPTCAGFTATPGTASHEKLALLTVLGTDRFPVDTE
ncbi:hypothetical protein [Streptomyces sp. NPDC054962]